MEDKRKKRVRDFKVRAGQDKWSSYPDELEIFITKNHQTSSFYLLPEEVEKVIITLQEALERMKK